MRYTLRRSVFLSLPLVIACSGNDADTSKQPDTTNSDFTESEAWASNYLTEMENLVSSSETLTKLNELETISHQIEKEILSPWKASWLSLDTEGYVQLLSSDQGLDWVQASQEVQRDSQGIEESTVQIVTGTDNASEFLAQFSEIHDLSLKITHIESTGTQSAIATVEFDLRAIKTDGTRQQDRGHITLTCEKDTTWKISRLEASDI